MKTSPYGTWTSPITADSIAAAGRRLGDIAVDGETVYWIESRPEQEGRNTIMMWRAGEALREVTPLPYNVRSRAHEYGGGAMAVHGGRVFFVNDTDRQIYHIPPGGSPQALTSESDTAYADMILDPARQRLILVQEHYFDDSRPPRDMLATLTLRGRPGYCEPLVAGNDFYASPALSRDGRQLCWLSWNHPAMPWNGTELWVAEVGEDGQLRRRAGLPEGRRNRCSSRNGPQTIPCILFPTAARAGGISMPGTAKPFARYWRWPRSLPCPNGSSGCRHIAF